MNNAQARTGNFSIGKLIALFRNGWYGPPIIANEKLTIRAGNRRWTAAKQVGRVRYSSKQWFETYVSSKGKVEEIANCPARTRLLCDRSLTFAGRSWEELVALQERGFAPHWWDIIDKVLGRLGAVLGTEASPSERQIVEWALEHGIGRLATWTRVRNPRQERAFCATCARSIQTNKPTLQRHTEAA